MKCPRDGCGHELKQITKSKTVSSYYCPQCLREYDSGNTNITPEYYYDELEQRFLTAEEAENRMAGRIGER